MVKITVIDWLMVRIFLIDWLMVRITLINGLVKKDYSDLLIGRWEITLVNGFLFLIDGKDYPF